MARLTDLRYQGLSSNGPRMRRTAIRLASIIALGLALTGCAKCGGWEKFNLPYSASGCDNRQ